MFTSSHRLRRSFLFVVLLAVLLQQTEAKKKRKRGQGLDRCKPFRLGCSLKQHNKSVLFAVDNFNATTLGTKCEDYVGQLAPEDLEVEEPHDVLEEYCNVSLSYYNANKKKAL